MTGGRKNSAASCYDITDISLKSMSNILLSSSLPLNINDTCGNCHSSQKHGKKYEKRNHNRNDLNYTIFHFILVYPLVWHKVQLL